MILRGGPRTQIFQTKKNLEDLGVQVSLFDSWKEFKKEEIDLVHFFGANIGTYHLAREIYKLGIPFVVSPIFFSLHSNRFLQTALQGDRYLRKLFRGIWTDYGLMKDICMWAKAVLPNTTNESQLLERGLGVTAHKISVIPNGVEERFYHADKNEFIKKYGVENFILNVGHIGPERKNVLRLIHALEDIDTPAVIIGRIENNANGRACLEAAERNPRLLILDSIPNDSSLLASAYAACDVFVLPSLFETPGIAALEAALAGAKIVITKYGGTAEYFGNKAEYVEPTSIDDIKRGIIAAQKKPKTDELRFNIKNEFLWDTVARKTLKAYEQVLLRRE